MWQYMGDEARAGQGIVGVDRTRRFTNINGRIKRKPLPSSGLKEMSVLIRYF